MSTQPHHTTSSSLVESPVVVCSRWMCNFHPTGRYGDGGSVVIVVVRV